MTTRNAEAKPNRRQVITTAGAATLAAGMSALTTASSARPGSKPHVVIVGAGLSGLCAAYLLQQKNWTYTILEAERHHVGGRVRTMPIGNRGATAPIGDQFYWEAGAMRIPTKHKKVLDYIGMFSELELRRFVMYNPRTFKFARRVRSMNEPDIKKEYRLKANEEKFTAEELWKMTVKNLAQGLDGYLDSGELKELKTALTFTSEKLIKLDRLSLRQVIQEARPKELGGVALSDEAIEFLLFAYGNLGIQQYASTEFLREENIGIWDSFMEIKGGTSRFPRAFARRLTGTLKMGHEVIRLEQDRAGVKAICRFEGREMPPEKGDFLLCTIPMPVLAQVEAIPPFSFDKQRAILEMGYDSGTKVVLLTKERFWEKNDGIFGGSSTTDMITGSLIYPSDNAGDDDGTKPLDPSVSDRPGVLIASYSWGQDARRLGAMPASAREDLAIRQVSQVHPELVKYPDMILARASWAWDSYRWCGGAFAFYQPGQFTRMHQHVMQPEGRIHFAGEHCSHSHSWMEGALESAETAVEALTKAG
jgi:monoamine oxidase